MRVLFLEELHGYGGAERYVEYLAAALFDLGVHVHVLVFAVDPRAGEKHALRLRESGVDVRTCHRRPGPGAVGEQVARLDPDLLHWCFPHPFAFGAGGLLLIPWGRPSIATEHLPNLGERRRWELVRAAANLRVAQMIVGSEGSRETALAKWGRLAPAITVIRNGVPLPRVTKAARSPDEPLELLFVGRLEDQKNPAFVLEVQAAMQRAGHPTELRMVGDGSLEASLRSRATELGTHPTWLGFVDDLTPLLSRADVLLMPSAFESGLTLAAIESLGAGVPVLASDIAVHRGTGPNEGALELLPVGEASRWAEAAAAMARRSHELACDARAIAERFSAGEMARQTLALYERAVPVLR